MYPFHSSTMSCIFIHLNNPYILALRLWLRLLEAFEGCERTLYHAKHAPDFASLCVILER